MLTSVYLFLLSLRSFVIHPLLHCGQLAGTDGVRLELIKYRGIKLLNRTYELVTQIWEAERIPEEWKETIIISIYKKGDRDMCENERGIA